VQIGTKFTVAIHILLLSELLKETHKITSDFIASSVNTNPVVIRKIMGQLRSAGLIEIAAGTGGIRLLKTPREISLLDVFRAAEPLGDGTLFKIHSGAAQACLVGANIERLLDRRLATAQAAMEACLAKTKLAELISELDSKSG